MGSLAAALERSVKRTQPLADALDGARARVAYRASLECVLHALDIGPQDIASGAHFDDQLAVGAHYFVDALHRIANALGDADVSRVVGRFFAAWKRRRRSGARWSGTPQSGALAPTSRPRVYSPRWRKHVSRETWPHCKNSKQGDARHIP